VHRQQSLDDNEPSLDNNENESAGAPATI